MTKLYCDSADLQTTTHRIEAPVTNQAAAATAHSGQAQSLEVNTLTTRSPALTSP